MTRIKSLAAITLACAAGSSFAVDYNWSDHGAVETFTMSRSKGGEFIDDARYLVSNALSKTTGVKGRLVINEGASFFNSIKIEFWGDFYGPDQKLGEFLPNQDFYFEHIDMRKKYYYLVTTDKKLGLGTWTLTSELLSDSQLKTATMASPVPEPSVYAMFLAGLGALPLAARLRRRSGGKTAS